jgi:hypothetical protein
VVLGTSKAIAPETLRSLYDGWDEEPEPRRRRRGGASRRPDDLVLTKPKCPPDTRSTPLAASN